ncbi:MAG: ATPase, T2SS/T4P/T4SS family, partial [Candidatus Diapherotrites archaeon]
MRLIVDGEKCDNCLKCLVNCPNGLESIAAIKCAHCSPEKAACFLICGKGAIYEVAEGILSVDEGLCDGCGECVKACEQGAIEISGGKAKKCDLCAGNGFFMQCIESCEKGAIRLKRSWREMEEADNLLGWRVRKIREPEKCRVLKTGINQEIVELRNGKKILCINGFPELTRQEAFLLKKLLEEFREENAEGNKSTKEVLRKICENNSIALDEEQENYLAELASEISFRFAPISAFLGNEEIEEIALTGLGRENPIYVYDSSFGWMESNLYFSSESFAKNLVNRMARKIGRRLSVQTPKINAVLPDGCRINACIEPVSFSGPAFTIRKFRQNPFTPLDLITGKIMSAKAMAFIWMVLETDSSLLLCGNTSSGKTTTLNALFSFIPLDERIIIVEETPEIKIPHRHKLSLTTVAESDIGMQSLITDTLRMRPDRVIVG